MKHERISAQAEYGPGSSVELVEQYLDRIRAVDSDIRAFLYVDEEGALAQAKASDERRRRGEPFLHGTAFPSRSRTISVR